MLNIAVVVKYMNNSLQNDIKTYAELLDEFSTKYNCDIADELQKNNYTVITVYNKKKIVLKDELNDPKEKKAERAIDTEEKMDYEKLLNFNSDSVFSVRIDSEINKKFQKFCKKNKKITKNKLVSLALYEFLIKYN